MDARLELDAMERGADPRVSAVRPGPGGASTELQQQADTARLREKVRQEERDKWEQAADQVPADLFMYLGNARMRDGRPADAVEAYEQAARRATNAPEPHYNLAVALLQSGRPADALVPCRRAQEMGYSPAAELLRHIEQSVPSDADTPGP
jgi:tetratricopeptide (TPR) repeat protein